MSQIDPVALAKALVGGQVKPKFQVEELPESHEVVREVISYEPEKSGEKTILKRNVKKKTINGGYMVYTARGDSLFVATEAELIRLGFHKNPALVHEEGEELDLPDAPDLKALANARTQSKRSASTASA